MSNMPTFENPCGAYSRYEITKAIPLERLEKICTAEPDGRLWVLPCKVGDTVYVIESDRLQDMKKSANEQPEPFLVLREHSVSTIVFNSMGVRMFTKNGLCFSSDIGKTVFLTREEAEAALRGEQNG